MSSKTGYLNLTLPANNEYQNNWDQPINGNFTLIDAFASTFGGDITDSHGNQDSLADFLAQFVSLSTGVLLPTAEVVSARNSFLYGAGTGNPLSFLLADRLQLSDQEIYAAREGRVGLRDGGAFKAWANNVVLVGTANSNGYPTWLANTGANLQVDGSATNIWMMIGGYLTRIRVLTQLTISGGSGTYYAYATFSEGGNEVINGDSNSSGPLTPPLAANGSTGADTAGNITWFEDATINFTTSNVKVGDILTITLGTNAGTYLISAIAPSGSNNNTIAVNGYFPGGALSGLNYTIYDPLAVTLGFSSTNTPTTGRFYFAKLVFDGTSISSSNAIQFKDYFIGEWRAVSTNYNELYNHMLFDDALEISVQVSQANDGSQPIQELATSSTTTTPTLGGTIPGGLTLSGGLVQSSALVEWTAYTVSIVNAVSGVFYTDYSNTTQTTGFIRVVVKKRRT